MDNNFSKPNGHSNGSYRGEYLNGYQGDAFTMGDSDNENINIDFRRIVAILLKYKWLIILVAALGAVAGHYYASSQTPIFRSSGTMIISQAPNQYTYVSSTIEGLLQSNYGIGVGSSLQQEIHALNSRSFGRELGERLIAERTMPDGSIYPLLLDNRGELINDIDVIGGRISSRLRISLGQNNILTMSFTSSNRDEAKRMVDLAMNTYMDLSTQITRRQARAAIEFINEETERLEQEVMRNQVRLMDAMLEHQVIDFENYGREYMEKLIRFDADIEMLKLKREFLVLEIERTQQELDRIRPTITDQVISSVTPRYAYLRQSLTNLREMQQGLEAQNPRLLQDPSIVPFYKQTLDKIAIVEMEMREIIDSYIDNPEESLFLTTSDQDFLNKIVGIRNNISNLQVELERNESELAFMENERVELLAEFDDIPLQIFEFSHIERAYRSSQQMYNRMLNQGAEIALWEQTVFGMGRVVDYGSRPNNPISPNIEQSTIFGLLVGLFGIIAVVFVVEYSRQTIQSPELLKQFNVPVLSVVPDIDQVVKKQFKGNKTVLVKGNEISSGLLMLTDSISPASEAYRRLASNLLYSQPDSDLNVIMVTSSIKGEGKTTTSANLAVALVESGKKVLVMDCDFRRPNVHRLFGLNRNHGITDIIFDNETISSTVKNSIVPGLDILTSGKKTPSPSAVSRSKKLLDIITEASKDYDHIILDTAPYGIITDAAPIMKLTDAVVLGIRFSAVKLVEVEQTILNMRHVKAPLVGLLVTGFDRKKSGSYYYHNQYYNSNYKGYETYHKEKELV